MVGCFGGVMFGRKLIGSYGGKGWNHLHHPDYSKMWWKHMVVGGMGHALGFVFECVT